MKDDSKSYDGDFVLSVATSPLQIIVYGGTLNNFHVTDIEAIVPLRRGNC